MAVALRDDGGPLALSCARCPDAISGGHTEEKDMRATQRVTGMLLAATIVAVGCSKSERKNIKGDQPASPPAKAAASVVKPDAREYDGEGFVGKATKPVAVALPITYPDGEAAYRAGQYVDARTIFEGYVGAHPKNAFGHYMLGLSAWKTKDLDAAEKAFRDALAIDPKHFKSHVNLSRVLLDAKKFDDAVEVLTKAGDLDPKSADVQRLLGRAWHNQKMLAEAESAYRAAVDLDVKDAWSLNNLGLVLLEQKKAEDAVLVLMKAIALKKDVAMFHNNLGMALEHTGDFKAAAKAYEDAVTTDIFYEKAKQNLARVSAVK
jgi:tetratricopeptide (TPR) repeat protein